MSFLEKIIGWHKLNNLHLTFLGKCGYVNNFIGWVKNTPLLKNGGKFVYYPTLKEEGGENEAINFMGRPNLRIW